LATISALILANDTAALAWSANRAVPRSSPVQALSAPSNRWSVADSPAAPIQPIPQQHDEGTRRSASREQHFLNGFFQLTHQKAPTSTGCLTEPLFLEVNNDRVEYHHKNRR